MQQMDAQRSQVRGFILELGPDGSVQAIPTTSSAPFENYLPWETAHLLDENLVAAAGLLDDDGGGDLPAAGPRRSGKRARVGAASEEAILGLKRVLGVQRSGEECAVCLQGFRADETLRAMPCSHAFHRHCISTWLRRNAVCPLCRHHLVSDEEDEDREERVTRRRGN